MAHILDLLRDRVLLCDGAMGSHLQAANLHVEQDYCGHENCSEILIDSRPDLIRDIHIGYFEAGADMVETNSFGGSPLTLGEFGLEAKAFDLNKRAGELAREAAKASVMAASASCWARSAPARVSRRSAISPIDRWRTR